MTNLRLQKVPKQRTNNHEVESEYQINVTIECLTHNDRLQTFENLKYLSVKIIYNPIIVYLNTNSVRNKFTDFSDIIANYVDIYYLAETKLDGTFPRNQFSTQGL